MRRWLRWVGLILLMVLVTSILLWTWSRLRGPTAAQRQALEVLEAGVQPEGRNAFAALWLLRYDVPEAELEAVVAEDAERMQAARAIPATDDPYGAGSFALRSVAHERYRDLKLSSEDEELLCRSWEPDCLRRVRAAPDAYRTLTASNARLFERIEALSGYDYYRSLLPFGLEVPFPEFQNARALLTRHVVQFAQGEVDTALEGACRELSTWRRLGADSDSLVMRMIGIAYSAGAGSLLAEMLAELPLEHPLPTACAAAVEPPTAEELWLCEPMRGEFRYLTGTLSAVFETDSPTSSVLGNLRGPLFFDAKMSRAQAAGAFASFCAQEELQRVAADSAVTSAPPVQTGLLRLECVSNAIGCILLDIGGPAYQPYQHRAQDHGARLKLLASLLWLRTGEGKGLPLAERIAQRPAAYKSPSREIEIAEDGRALQIQMFDTARGEYWQTPLPPDLWEVRP